MRLTPAFTLATLVALGGCTHAVALNRTATVDEYRAVSRTLAAKEAEVVTRDGLLYPLFNIEFSRDSLFGVWIGNGSRAISMRDVLEIKGGRDREDGARHGLKIGALIGAGMGFLSSLSPDETCYVAPCPGTTAYVIQMAVSGALWGVVIGAIRGNRIQYVVTR